MATDNTVINDTTIGSVAERFRMAVEALDTEAVLDLVADDVRLFSPVPRRPFEGKEMLGVVFGFLRTVIADPVFRSVLYGEGEAVLRFEGTLAGETCNWIHPLEIGPDGLISSITDQLRPLSAVLALQAAADRHLGVTTGGDDAASVPLEAGTDPTRAFMEQAYEAYAAYDIDAIINLFADDVVFHVAGHHPLAGDLHGPDAVLGYLAAVASTSGGRGGFNVRSLLTDGELGVAIVDGTAHDRERLFTRPIIHIFRVVDGHMAEFWDNPFDQHAEDEFWTTAGADQPGSRSLEGTPAPAGAIEDRLPAPFVELEPADQDALSVSMSAERNKARALELVRRVLNDHDLGALDEFTSVPAVVASGSGLVGAFPDLKADVRWAVAEDDMVVLFHGVRGTQQGPWLFVEEPTGRPVETSFMLAFRFDDDGMIVDQWLGSNFIEMLTQLGWGFSPLGPDAAGG